MPKGLDLIGQRFGKLTVVRMGHRRGRVWYCVCDCGKEKEKPLTSYELRAGKRLSCGCDLNPRRPSRMTHGMSGTKLYRIWSSMKHRCLNPADKHYANYGGRGIRICDEWLVFENFLEWARASGYREGLTIERINNDGNYEPGNCKWVPKPEQSNNTRRSKLVTFRGRTMTLKDWAEELGLPYHLLQARLTKYGWSVERAFTTPAIPQHRSHVRLIEWQGETKSIAEWARFFGISEKLLYRRLAAGWSFERAVTEPIDKRKRRVAAATGVPVYVAPA